MSDNLESICALSPTQAEMLLHTLRSADSTVWRIQFAVTLAGDVDSDALERAWQATVRRHAILRTAFFWENLEKPLQVAYRTVPFRLQRDEAHQARSIEQLAMEDREKGLDLSRAPVMRMSLVRLPGDRHALIWTFHHIILDGWSLGLVLRDAMTAFQAIRDGREPPLLPSPPYRDYIAWLRGQDLSGEEAYWRRALRGFHGPAPLNLAPAGGTPLLEGHGGGREELRLSAEVTQRLAALAKAQRVPLNTVVVAAWGLVLARQCGWDEVVLGVTMSSRPATLPLVRERVGVFINTLPIRLRVPSRTPFLAWLETVQAQLAELQEHSHTPLDQVRAWSGLAPGTPMFESHLVFENYPFNLRGMPLAPGIEVTDAQSFEWNHHPLTVMVEPGDQLEVRLQYQRHRFAPQPMRRLLADYGEALERIAAAPERAIEPVRPARGAGARQKELRRCATNPPIRRS